MSLSYKTFLVTYFSKFLEFFPPLRDSLKTTYIKSPADDAYGKFLFIGTPNK